MFTQGNLEMLRYLPPLRGIMVWRDPRNHYAQLVTNDYGIEDGDVEGFVTWYREMMIRLAKSLNDCSENHTNNILHVSFEYFVQNKEYRDKLGIILGTNSATYKPENFLESESLPNTILWKEWHNQKDIEYITERLGVIIDFCAELKSFNIEHAFIGTHYDARKDNPKTMIKSLIDRIG